MAIPEKLPFSIGIDSTTTSESRERPLAGKVALITGSSRDIGAEIAITLAKEGINIIGNYREKQKRAADMLRTINLLGAKAEFVQADITNANDRIRLRETVEKSFGGKLDFLILNASGPTEKINVVANNALVDDFLPLMSRGSVIVLMQSVPGHFAPHSNILAMTPEFYKPIAEAKYKGEQSLKKRIGEFKEKGVSFIVVCPPEVADTSNMKIFKREDPQVSKKHAEISKRFGLPEKVTKERVGEKVAEILKRKDFPIGYVEFSRQTNAR